MKKFDCFISRTLVTGMLFFLGGCGVQPVKSDSTSYRNKNKLLAEFLPQLQSEGWMKDRYRECNLVKGQSLCLTRTSYFEPYIAELTILEDHPDKINIDVIQTKPSLSGSKEILLERLRKLFH